MKKKIRKYKKRKQTKLFLFLHLTVISIILVLSTIVYLKVKSSQHVFADTAGYYVPVSPSPNSSANTLQMDTIQFQFIAYTPTPTPPSSLPGSSSSASSSSTGPGSSKGKQLASLTTSMVNNIHSKCGGRVYAGNVNCVNGVGPKGAVAQLKLNVSEDYYLQCAGFAQAVAIGVNLPIGNGNASTYAGRKINGYKWIPNRSGATIQLGDVPVWSGFGCQHIAVVTKVFGTYSFQVGEANGEAGIFGPAGTVVFDKYGMGGFSTCSLLGWQHAL